MNREDKIILELRNRLRSNLGSYTIQFVRPGFARPLLVSFTKDPVNAMYLTTRAYKGIHDYPLDQEHPDYSKQQAIEDIQNTKLQTPMEMVHMLWHLRYVSRAFTHQLVRYRVGTSFVQESMRFYGMQNGVFRILVTGGMNITETDEYVVACASAIEAYVELIAAGVPDQDARGVLPTNILTHIYFDCSLRTLQNIFPQRLCCQAQPGEWQHLLREMRNLIKQQMGNEIEDLLKAPYEKGEDCGYRASFDRPCIWKQEKENVSID